jgi:hypothetical protein
VTALRRSRSFAALILATFLMGAAACGNPDKADIQIREAVRQHLATRTDLGRMEVELDDVKYDGDQAAATVTIKARNDEKAQLQMTYNLRRVDSEWKVQPSAGAGHGGGGAAPPASGLPPGHPPAGGGRPQGGGQMPPSHPPISGESQQPQKELPKGHPPVSN